MVSIWNLKIEGFEEGSRKVNMSRTYKVGERVASILKSTESKRGEKKFREVLNSYQRGNSVYGIISCKRSHN